MEAVNSIIVDQTEEEVKYDGTTEARVGADQNCGGVMAQWSPEQSNMADEESVATDFLETIIRPTIICHLNHLRGDPSTTLTAAQLDVLDGVDRDLLVAAVRRSLLLPPVSLDQRPNDDGRVLSPPQPVAQMPNAHDLSRSSSASWTLPEIEEMVDIGVGKDNDDDDTNDDHDDSKEDDDHNHDDSKEDEDDDHSKDDNDDNDDDNVNSDGNGDGTGLGEDPPATTAVESAKAAVKPRGKSLKSSGRVTRVARRLICCVPSRR